MAEGKAPATGEPPGGTTPAGDAIRRGGTRAVGAALPALVRNAFRRQGFAAIEVVTRWTAIVGPRLARRTMPEKVTFPPGRNGGGTLHVRVEGPLATELQHVEPQIVEKVNAFYGYEAISHIALKQGRMPPGRVRPARRERALTEDARRTLDGAVAPTGDEGLRNALAALGRRVLADEPFR